ncbi:hypothetical protein LZ30DRAFT_769999 [Colletotrichum cereale]|nr:hypothetical protein LZ30DRAFT_769999 [Colletotrichum cereale]
MTEKDITPARSTQALVVSNVDLESQPVGTQELMRQDWFATDCGACMVNMGAEDPNNLYNRTTCRKVTIDIVITTGHLITLMSTSAMASALPQVSKDLRIDAATTQFILSGHYDYTGIAVEPKEVNV